MLNLYELQKTRALPAIRFVVLCSLRGTKEMVPAAPAAFERAKGNELNERTDGWQQMVVTCSSRHQQVQGRTLLF